METLSLTTHNQERRARIGAKTLCANRKHSIQSYHSTHFSSTFIVVFVIYVIYIDVRQNYFNKCKTIVAKSTTLYLR